MSKLLNQHQKEMLMANELALGVYTFDEFYERFVPQLTDINPQSIQEHHTLYRQIMPKICAFTADQFTLFSQGLKDGGWNAAWIQKFTPRPNEHQLHKIDPESQKWRTYWITHSRHEMLDLYAQICGTIVSATNPRKFKQAVANVRSLHQVFAQLGLTLAELECFIDQTQNCCKDQLIEWCEARLQKIQNPHSPFVGSYVEAIHQHNLTTILPQQICESLRILDHMCGLPLTPIANPLRIHTPATRMDFLHIGGNRKDALALMELQSTYLAAVEKSVIVSHLPVVKTSPSSRKL